MHLHQFKYFIFLLNQYDILRQRFIISQKCMILDFRVFNRDANEEIYKRTSCN